jgi:glycosyltransferase involved in cell wall biosynthesis
MCIIVSIVPYTFLPAKVGGQKGIALFNKYLSRHLRLVCVTTTGNVADAAEGYEVLPILSTSPLRYINPFYYYKLKKLLLEKKATHLIIEHPYYAWLAYLLKKSLKIPLIVHSHNLEGLRWKSLGKWWWPVLWQYEKFIHQQADISFFIQQQDLEYATRKFNLDPSSAMVVTFGIERNTPPTQQERKNAKKQVADLHKLDVSIPFLFFNGAFEYQPNIDALSYLLKKINPLLLEKKGFRYQMIICGRSIPKSILNQSYPNVVFAGFVDDIEMYFKAADVFVNPILSGGGIKTKLVEALGYNCNAVSTANGALGVDPDLCNAKLLIVPDKDWKLFAEKVIEIALNQQEISDAFFAHFYWGYIASRAERFIEQKTSRGEALHMR